MAPYWLGLDFGNTHLKAARIRADSPPEPLGRVDFTRPLPPALSEGALGCIVCSVRTEGSTLALLGGLAGRVVLVGEALPESEVGVPGQNERPLGEDRRLHCLGLRSLWPEGPVAAVSLGSAVALTAWDGEGVFAGGHLFPGRQASAETLSRLARLPDVRLGAEGHRGEPGMDTVTSIRSGVAVGWQAAVTALVADLDKAVGGARWAATGGDLAALAGGPISCDPVPDLLWLGMSVLARRL